MKMIVNNQTIDRKDEGNNLYNPQQKIKIRGEGNANHPQQKIKVSGQFEDTSDDYIRPQLPNHGNRPTTPLGYNPTASSPVTPRRQKSAELDGKLKAKTEEERAKPKKYLWLALTIVIAVLIVVVVVVTTVGKKGNDDEPSQLSGNSESYDDLTTPEPNTEPPTSPVAAWAKYGSDINGESAGDQFGFLIALSGDGSTIAGANGGEDAGSVRVFRFQGNYWTRIGQDITGESAGGMTVATSYDGSTVAIGGQNYGSTSKGQVRVLEYNSATDRWNPLGYPIYSSNDYDFFGSSVSLAGNGRILAVGAIGGDMKGENSGYAGVLEYDDGTQVWYQVGQTISGEKSDDQAGGRESVKLSNDGKMLAIGSRFMNGDGFNTGRVRVFRYDGAAYKWTQMGQSIEEANAGDIGFGITVDLSRDGTMIAIGAPLYKHDGKENCGLAQLYAYNDSDGSWYKTFGGYGLENDACGMSVSLSGDGKKVAVGCPQVDGKKPGTLQIYQYSDDLEKWVNTLYVPGENEFDIFGVSVSLSDEGNVVAAGGYFYDDNVVGSGHIRVYKSQ